MSIESHEPGREAADVRMALILKRQIPIRFEEPPRSWLGGLPMMPKHTPWPRDGEGMALHLLVQVSCADIPAELWNGLGPRYGWLLLFINGAKLSEDYDFENGEIQVLHTEELGVEHEPPEDAPTVRHAMSDYIGYDGPVFRRGVPKNWRKWPVDLVVHRYTASDKELQEHGPPVISGAELYGAPQSEYSVHGRLPFGHPLTWRGMLYIVECALRDIKPGRYRHSFDVLVDAPEVDPEEFRAEFNRRAGFIEEIRNSEGIDWEARRAAKAALEAEIRDERRPGWIRRALARLDKIIVEYRAKDLEQAVGWLERHRTHLAEIEAAYPGPEGEARFNEEIRTLGKAQLARLPEHRAKLERLMEHVLAQDLDAAFPPEEWETFRSIIEGAKGTFWKKQSDRDLLRKVEEPLLRIRDYIDMAIREDALDLYTRAERSHPALTPAFLEEFEKMLRGLVLHHQMGGLEQQVQSSVDLRQLRYDARDISKPEFATPKLLYQIATDYPMGWSWGDAGALYVNISSTDLRALRFDKLDPRLESN